MKTKIYILILLCFFAAASCGFAAPTAFFPEKTHRFSPVIEGTKVVYDFKILNKGTGVLNVEKVKTG